MSFLVGKRTSICAGFQEKVESGLDSFPVCAVPRLLERKNGHLVLMPEVLTPN